MPEQKQDDEEPRKKNLFCGYLIKIRGNSRLAVYANAPKKGNFTCVTTHEFLYQGLEKKAFYCHIYTHKGDHFHRTYLECTHMCR